MLRSGAAHPFPRKRQKHVISMEQHRITRAGYSVYTNAQSFVLAALLVELGHLYTSGPETPSRPRLPLAHPRPSLFKGQTLGIRRSSEALAGLASNLTFPINETSVKRIARLRH